jgi:hypothetical protein
MIAGSRIAEGEPASEQVFAMPGAGLEPARPL